MYVNYLRAVYRYSCVITHQTLYIVTSLIQLDIRRRLARFTDSITLHINECDQYTTNNDDFKETETSSEALY